MAGAPPSDASLPARPAVLYLHGFVDYFFQTHVANAFEARGYRFYAIDLRGYGRSIGCGIEEGEPNYVPDIAVYAQDLDAAVAAIREEGHTGIAFHGHSTGGLIGPLWANARPGLLAAMALNSPWLELNENWFLRVPATGLISLVSRVAPTLKVSGLWPYYGEALHQGTGGEWEYNLAWKPHVGFPVAAAWFNSVRRAHRRIKRGLDVTCPILVLTSTKRGDNRRQHPEVITSDSVLNPAHMWALAPNLGSDVEVRTIPGGAHDLSLSPEPARSAYLDATLNWLDAVTAGPATPPAPPASA
jgi:alpha-beta hydrolase superfamily lysophospholipase